MSKFSLGTVVMTAGAHDVLQWRNPREFLSRHVNGDWGDMPEEDKEENERGLDPEYPQRLMSCYVVDGEKIWVITEQDRSVTTILLPDEY
jgi:hypothetical protein